MKGLIIIMNKLAMDISKKTNYYTLYKEKITKTSLEINESDYISSGCFGSVFFYKDGCIKVAKCLIPKTTISILEELKKITHPNLYRIRNFYYNSMDESAYAKAYDMDYYLSDSINILTMPIDYILDNMNDLCKLACKMASYSILMTDTHEENVILQKNRMILIDADRWVMDLYDSYDLKIENYSAIVHLLCRLYYQALIDLGKIDKRSYGCNYNDYNRVLNQLERISIEEVLKEHQGFKYPIDYIDTKVKRLR